jgi:hypothetical protein
MATLLPDPGTVGVNGVGLRRVSCCNHAATGAVHTRTEQESNSARNAKNRLDKRIFRQNRTYPESFDLTYKEGVAGSNPASPTIKTKYLQEKDVVSNEVQRTILREAEDRYRNELMDVEERMLLLDRIKRIRKTLGILAR